MIVVDSNVLAYLYLPGDFTADAESLMLREPAWAAPVLWRSQFRNILSASIRRESLSFEQAMDIQREAESLMSGLEFEVDSGAVLELVRDSDCSAYDCEFIALAIKLDTQVITMDKKLLKAFPDKAVALRPHV